AREGGRRRRSAQQAAGEARHLARAGLGPATDEHRASHFMNTSTLPHVLAVDDDPSVRGLLADYLADNEMRVTAVATGKELDHILERDPVDVVVLDVRLHGEDGMQIARRLRERWPAMPILMLTGRADEADRVMGLELGADDYLTKPFSPRELLA